jgi:hypothetical protein
MNFAGVLFFWCWYSEMSIFASQSTGFPLVVLNSMAASFQLTIDVQHGCIWLDC